MNGDPNALVTARDHLVAASRPLAEAAALMSASAVPVARDPPPAEAARSAPLVPLAEAARFVADSAAIVAAGAVPLTEAVPASSA